MVRFLKNQKKKLQNKRKKMADGSTKTSSDLHLDTSDLMELDYECVAGEPPAAAAKLRSGMFAFFRLHLVGCAMF